MQMLIDQFALASAAIDFNPPPVVLNAAMSLVYNTSHIHIACCASTNGPHLLSILQQGAADSRSQEHYDD